MNPSRLGVSPLHDALTPETYIRQRLARIFEWRRNEHVRFLEISCHSYVSFLELVSLRSTCTIESSGAPRLLRSLGVDARAAATHIWPVQRCHLSRGLRLGAVITDAAAGRFGRPGPSVSRSLSRVQGVQFVFADLCQRLRKGTQRLFAALRSQRRRGLGAAPVQVLSHRREALAARWTK